MRALVQDLRAQIERIAAGGPQDAVAKHKKAGKLTARERLGLLLDAGAPFLELSQLAAHGLYGGDAPGAGADHGHRPRSRARRA